MRGIINFLLVASVIYATGIGAKGSRPPRGVKTGVLDGLVLTLTDRQDSGHTAIDAELIYYVQSAIEPQVRLFIPKQSEYFCTIDLVEKGTGKSVKKTALGRQVGTKFNLLRHGQKIDRFLKAVKDLKLQTTSAYKPDGPIQFHILPRTQDWFKIDRNDEYELKIVFQVLVGIEAKDPKDFCFKVVRFPEIRYPIYRLLHK